MNKKAKKIIALIDLTAVVRLINLSLVLIDLNSLYDVYSLMIL